MNTQASKREPQPLATELHESPDDMRGILRRQGVVNENAISEVTEAARMEKPAHARELVSLAERVLGHELPVRIRQRKVKRPAEPTAPENHPAMAAFRDSVRALEERETQLKKNGARSAELEAALAQAKVALANPTQVVKDWEHGQEQERLWRERVELQKGIRRLVPELVKQGEKYPYSRAAQEIRAVQARTRARARRK